MALTVKQAAFLGLIVRFTDREGVTPTVREMKELGGFKSPRSVLQYLNVLEAEGCIRRVAGARNIRIVRQAPRVVCLCGSTRFGDAFRAANLSETLAGRIVLSIGCDMRSDVEIFGHLTVAEAEQVKAELDELHKRKIDLADEILVLNVGGYIGKSTRSEIDYAEALGKPVRYLEGA